jgi:hypothetical protein
MSRPGRYARYYTFTLTEEAQTIINLESTVDTYMYILTGSGPNTVLVEEDDDGGIGYNSQMYVLLAPGDYTIEATTYSSGMTGSFTVTLD